MAGDARDVRIEERLKIKIAEAKNLPPRSHGAPTHRDTYCVLSLDQEEIFRTATMERTLNPFFGEEFQFEVPRHFRHLSIYVFDRDKDRHLKQDKVRHLKQDKVLGKVAIRREDLQSYNNKDHWFALSHVDADSEVQGKAHIEILFEESYPKITSLSPDYNQQESPRIPQRNFPEMQNDGGGGRSPVDELTASNLSVDRKTKAKNISKNITEYCKESMKFGSCSSTGSKKLFPAIAIAENLSGLARSESLRSGGLNVQCNQTLHHTYGPSSSRKHISLNCQDASRVPTQQSMQIFSPSSDTYPTLTDSDFSPDSIYMSDNSTSDGTQYQTIPDLKNKLSIRVLECSELTMKNGQCDPYAVVTVVYSNDKKVSRRTKVKKKTVNPQFDECFVFDLTLDCDSTTKERDSSNNTYTIWPLSSWGEPEACEVCVSLWHDAPGALGGGATFLGEVRAPLRGAQQRADTSAWYFLRSRSGQQWPRGATPPGTRLSAVVGAALGSLRLVLQHTLDRVLPPPAYEGLKALLLRTATHKPITSSAVYILGELVASKADAAQPLVRLFTNDDLLVPIIRALADAELSTLSDPSTIFRGNTLVSKMMDEAMRLTGLIYLQHTLRPTLDIIFAEKKPCEIDPTRVKDQSTVETNLANLKEYVEKMFDAITQSFIHCPNVMCRLFDALRQCAAQRFPRNAEVRYSVVSGFIFLRFFAPAILGPKLFDLATEQIDPQTNRTLTLISKTIQSLGNLVSSQVCKEEYMVALYKCFCTERHVQAIKRFLEIISSSTETQNSSIQDTPVLLKEGTMIKKAQGRKRFGRANLKQRHFRLTSCELSYSKAKGKRPLCSIPLAEIVSAQMVPEVHNLKMNNMFQIEYKDRVLYIQANNCVERKEWLDLLGKLCEGHRPPPQKYHPGSFSYGHWTCCTAGKADAAGCVESAPLAARSPPPEFRLRLDPARDLQRVHCLLISNINTIEAMLLRPRAGIQLPSSASTSVPIEDLTSYQKTLRELKEVTYSLEQQHRAHLRSLARETKYGSKQAPIGDDNYLNLRGDRANVSLDGQHHNMGALRMYHSATAPSLQTSPPTLRHFTVPSSLQIPSNNASPNLLPKFEKVKPPIHLSLAPDKECLLRELHLQSPKKPLLPDKICATAESTYLNNSLYISSSTESMKFAERHADERLLGNSNKSTSATGSGYLKMNCLINEVSDVSTSEVDSKNSSVNSCISPTEEVLKNDRLTPPATAQKPSCEYVEVRPKVPERETKPKPSLPPSSSSLRHKPTLEELADNPQIFCQEYELMSNFTSAAKNRGFPDDTKHNDDLPPAVPPRSHHNTPAKYPGKVYLELHKQGKFQDQTKSDRSTDSFLREHKCLEQYQLKNTKCTEDIVTCTPLRIIEDGDVIEERLGVNTLQTEDKSRSDCAASASQESRSQNKCDFIVPLSEVSDKESNLRKSNSEVKEGDISPSETQDDMTQCDFTTQVAVAKATVTTQAGDDDSGSSKKPSGKVKEESGFLSRKSIQRKSIPIKSKPSTKKTNSVDGALALSEPSPAESVTKSQSAFSFFKKKSKVSTDTVRLPPIC